MSVGLPTGFYFALQSKKERVHMTKEPKKLKRVVIKEELVALTGDFKKAIILNQFLYWSERIKDVDKFLIEERKRMEDHGIEIREEDVVNDLQNGWIYKKAEELSEETMLGLSKSNMGKHIDFLVENGWLDKRRNPKYQWDKTYQYRVNIVKIQMDLQKLGYSLEGYPLFTDDTEVLKQNSEVTEMKHRSSKTELQSHETEPQSSKTEQQYQRLQTEITNRDYITTTTEVSAYTPSDAHQENVVVEVDPIQQFAKQHGINISAGTLRKWRKQADDEKIMRYLEYAIANADKPLALVNDAITNGYDPTLNESVTRKVKSTYIEKLRRAGAK
jgi:DNA-binding MarR family transcriptional regulator